jgi:hypothetical protein
MDITRTTEKLNVDDADLSASTFRNVEVALCDETALAGAMMLDRMEDEDARSTFLQKLEPIMQTSIAAL